MCAGKMVLKQMVCDNRAFPAGISCEAMALSNYHLFVADSKGSLYTLRCDIKNGMLLVCHLPFTAVYMFDNFLQRNAGQFSCRRSGIHVWAADMYEPLQDSCLR